MIFGLGFFAGVVFTIVFFIVRNIDPAIDFPNKLSATDFATLLAGALGAVLGGGISWMASSQASSETLARDGAAREEAQKAVALGVLLKVQQIANGYYTQKQYIWDALRKANDKKEGNRDLWQKVQPQVGNSHPPPRFSAEEFVPLVVLKRTDTIDECNLLALRYDVMNKSVEVYNQKREAMQEFLLKLPTKVDEKGQSSTEIPDEHKAEAALRARELEGLIQDIYRHVREDGLQAHKLCETLNKTFSAGFKGFIKLDYTANYLDD